MIVQEKSLSISEIRKDFPILKEIFDPARSLVYLDNAATTQKPEQVLQALNHYYRHQNANVHRALHTLGERATNAYENAREKAAKFIGANGSNKIVFTRGTTEAINLVATAWAAKNIQPGQKILLTEMEHHSNLVPWQILAQEKKIKLEFIPFDDNGVLDLSQLDNLLQNSALVAMTHMSNVFGTINSVEEIIAKAHKRSIPVLLDAAQSVPHMKVNVAELDCDFLAFSGHKMCAPTGIGVLYIAERRLAEMSPYQGGGEMISSVRLESSTWNEPPHKFEAGTPNIAGAVGLSAAMDYLTKIGMGKIAEYEKEIGHYALGQLQQVEGLRIIGPRQQRGAVISFVMEKIHPHDIAQFLDADGIAVRAGHHCAQPAMRKLKIAATARASFYFYNTFEEVDKLVAALEKTRKFFAG